MFSREDRFIFACLGSASNEGAVSEIHMLLRKGLDWDYILQTAQQSRIVSLLYHSLGLVEGHEVVPGPIWRALRNAYYQVGLRNLLCHSELENVLSSFNLLGIETIILKGAALGEIFPEYRALREMSDVDLMVQEKDLEAADEALSKLGYSHCEYYRPREWYKTHHHHWAPRYHPIKETAIEIHRNILPQNMHFHMNPDGLWKRSGNLKIGAAEAKALSPEDLIIHLCLNSSLFGFRDLRGLSDICRVVGQYNETINWDWILKEAHEGGFTAHLYYPLSLAADVMDATIRERIPKNLRKTSEFEPLRDRLLRMIVKRTLLVRDESNLLFPDWFWAGLCKELLKRRDLTQLVTFIGRSLLRAPLDLPGDNKPSSISGPLSPYYAVRRSIKLAHRFCKVMVKSITRIAGWGPFKPATIRQENAPCRMQ
ncbi:nucleotidyltransferase family protein [Candidatus Poribacteria bacterium]|nr:nucleotidyltransferase family protein [Candidatus Poribacteria bacterium]